MIRRRVGQVDDQKGKVSGGREGYYLDDKG